EALLFASSKTQIFFRRRSPASLRTVDSSSRNVEVSFAELGLAQPPDSEKANASLDFLMLISLYDKWEKIAAALADRHVSPESVAELSSWISSHKSIEGLAAIRKLGVFNVMLSSK